MDALGELTQKVAQGDGIAVAFEVERGREVPACDVDMRPGLPQLLGHRRQSLGAVDEDLHRVSGARRKGALRPAARRGVERPLPIEPLKPPVVVGADLAADGRAEPTLGRDRHGPQPRDRLL